MIVPVGPFTFRGDQERIRQGDATMDRQETDGWGVDGGLEVFEALEVLGSPAEALRPASVMERHPWVLYAHG